MTVQHTATGGYTETWEWQNNRFTSVWGFFSTLQPRELLVRGSWQRAPTGGIHVYTSHVQRRNTWDRSINRSHGGPQRIERAGLCVCACEINYGLSTPPCEHQGSRFKQYVSPSSWRLGRNRGIVQVHLAGDPQANIWGALRSARDAHGARLASGYHTTCHSLCWVGFFSSIRYLPRSRALWWSDFPTGMRSKTVD